MLHTVLSPSVPLVNSPTQLSKLATPGLASDALQCNSSRAGVVSLTQEVQEVGPNFARAGRLVESFTTWIIRSRPATFKLFGRLNSQGKYIYIMCCRVERRRNGGPPLGRHLEETKLLQDAFCMTGVVEPGEPRSSANRGYSFSIPQAILMIWIWETGCGKDSGRKEGAGMWGSLMKKSPRN